MAITHSTIKAALQKLFAIADWNAAHVGTATPDVHGISDNTKHSADETPNQILKADANGLPTDATNTDAQAAAAVTHSIGDGSDHADVAANTAANHPNASRMRAYPNANQDIPQATATLVELDTETYDNNAEFNTGTHAFTAKTAGYYLVTAAIRYLEPLLNGNDAIFAIIYKNGAEVAEAGSTTISNYAASVVTDIIYLAVDDYIEMYTYHTFSEARQLRGDSRMTFMSIHKLS